jgi:hypothetical protein
MLHLLRLCPAQAVRLHRAASSLSPAAAAAAAVTAAAQATLAARAL